MDPSASPENDKTSLPPPPSPQRIDTTVAPPATRDGDSSSDVEITGEAYATPSPDRDMEIEPEVTPPIATIQVKREAPSEVAQPSYPTLRTAVKACSQHYVLLPRYGLQQRQQRLMAAWFESAHKGYTQHALNESDWNRDLLQGHSKEAQDKAVPMLRHLKLGMVEAKEKLKNKKSTVHDPGNDIRGRGMGHPYIIPNIGTTAFTFGAGVGLPVLNTEAGTAKDRITITELAPNGNYAMDLTMTTTYPYRMSQRSPDPHGLRVEYSSFGSSTLRYDIPPGIHEGTWQCDNRPGHRRD